MADSLYVCEDRQARRTYRRAREQQLALRPSSPPADGECPSHASFGEHTGTIAVGGRKQTLDRNEDDATDSGIGKSPATELLDLTCHSPSPCPSGGKCHPPSPQPRLRTDSNPAEPGEEHVIEASVGLVRRPPQSLPEAGPSRPALSLDTQVPTAAEDGEVDATPFAQTHEDQTGPYLSDVEMLNQLFRPNHFEDRDMIPLVDVSVDLSEVSEVNDPLEFLEEIKEIQRSALLPSILGCSTTNHYHRLIEAARNRWPTTLDSTQDAQATSAFQAEITHIQGAGLIGDNRDRASDSKQSRALRAHSLIFITYKVLGRFSVATDRLKVRARQARRRCTALLQLAKALAAFPFKMRISVKLD